MWPQEFFKSGASTIHTARAREAQLHKWSEVRGRIPQGLIAPTKDCHPALSIECNIKL